MPLFPGDRVRIIDNRQNLATIMINYDELVRSINSDFSTIRTILRRNSIQDNAWYVDGLNNWFTENCLELVLRGELVPGQQVRIIDDIEELTNSSINRDSLDEQLGENWNTTFLINSISSGWYTLRNDFVPTSFSYRRENLELVTDNMPEKKPLKAKVESEPVKLPTLEEIETMAAVDVYQKYYSKFKKIIDNDLYMTAKHDLHSSKSKVEFIAQLKKLFVGEISCSIRTEQDAKNIIINYLKEGANLREKLEILKKITRLENKCREYLKFGVIDEIKARTTILINREHSLLFSEGSKKNCTEYFELAKKYVGNLEELKELFANCEDNFEKIERHLKTIQAQEKGLEDLKNRLNISYKVDVKKITIIANRKELLERLDLIKDSEKEPIIDLLKNFQRDDAISVYAETKNFFKKHKTKI